MSIDKDNYNSNSNPLQNPIWENDADEFDSEEFPIGGGGLAIQLAPQDENENFTEKKISEQTTDSPDLSNQSEPLEVESQPAPPQIPPPPDGGLQAWLVVAAGFFALFNSFGIVNAFGSFQAYYSENLLKNESDSAISWIGAIQGFIIVFPGLFSGRLMDAGYGRQMIWVGTFLVTFGYMMASLATKYYQVLLAQGFCIGIGCNLLFIVSVAVVSQYFTTKRSIAIGISASGSSFGGVIYPIMVERLIGEVGYPWTARILGFTVLGTNIVCCLYMIPRLPPRKSGPLIDIPSLTDVPFLLFTFGSLIGFMSIYVPLFYIPSYTIHLGHSQSTALYMSSVINAASIFGRLLPNLVADRIGPFNTLIPCTFGVIIITFSWIAVDSLGGIIAFCLFFGFFSGSYVSMSPSCIANMTPNLSIMGTRMGMSFFVASAGVLIGGPAGGWLLARNDGNYLFAQIFAGVAVSVSFLCFVAARYLLKGVALTKC